MKSLKIIIVLVMAILVYNARTSLPYSDDGAIAPRVDWATYDISVGNIPEEDERVVKFLSKDFGLVRLSEEPAFGFDESEVRVWRYSGTILPECVRLEHLGFNPKFSYLQLKSPGTSYSIDLGKHSESLKLVLDGLMSNLTASKSLRANFEGDYSGTSYYLVEFRNRSAYQTRRFLQTDKSESVKIIREFWKMVADIAK